MKLGRYSVGSDAADLAHFIGFVYTLLCDHNNLVKVGEKFTEQMPLGWFHALTACLPTKWQPLHFV